MKKNGFTLIELLAVIVILAIIALIATPIILGIIKDSKKESTRISAENYFDAVELAISREYVKDPNKDLDGIYTISNEGKTLTKGEIILTVEYDGKSQLVIEEGISSISIEKGKIVSVSNVKIDNFYVVWESGKIKLSFKPTQSILDTGMNFNQKIKTLVNGQEMAFYSNDYKVTSIEFYSNGLLPENYTVETLQNLNNVDLSADGNNSIVAYNDNGKIYVYSKNLISFNGDSSQMFIIFNSLDNIIFNYIDTSNVTNMSGMFSGYSSDTLLDLSSFDTSNVTDMSSMFSNYSSTTALDLSKIDTSSVTNMSSMFSNYSSTTALDLSKIDTSNVTNMSWMFREYSSPVTLDLISLNMENVSDVSYMLSGYSSPVPLDLSRLDTSKITNMNNMFIGYSSSAPLDLSKLNTSNVTNMSWMFRNYSSSAPLDLSALDTSKVTDMSGMFEGYSSSTVLDLSKLNTSKVENMSGMFQCYSSEVPLNLNGFDTSNVSNMSFMFSSYNSEAPLDLTSFNTSKATDMSYMFAWSGYPITITLNKNTWITENANTESMFDGTDVTLNYSE